jgi:hypothetical protein
MFSTTTNLYLSIVIQKMVLPILKKVLMFVPNKLISISNNVNKVINLPETADKTFTYVTKVTGATTGAAGVAKGSADLVEAIACQDGICAVVSTIVTLPISVGCKVFVWCCKRSKLPWGTC